MLDDGSMVYSGPAADEARVPGSTVWWPPDRDEQREQVPGVLVFATAFVAAPRVTAA
jgi:hypothetical protein